MEFNLPSQIVKDLSFGNEGRNKIMSEEALDMCLRCDLHRITFKSMHLPLDSSVETIKQAVALCKEKGIELYGAGVVYMKTKVEASASSHLWHRTSP